jgi:phosphatidylglycerophosphate synthase
LNASIFSNVQFWKEIKRILMVEWEDWQEMIDDKFRGLIATRVGPLLRCYQVVGLTPNGVTLLGLIFGICSAVAVSQQMYILALTLWWLGRVFDGTDGIYARSLKLQSNFGGYLDIVCDMAAYGAMIIGFMHSYPEFTNWWTLILFLYILCITSALALGLLQNQEGVPSTDNRSLRLATGLAEGGETGIFYSLALIFPKWIFWLCPVWCVVLSVTVVARTLIARKSLKS